MNMKRTIRDIGKHDIPGFLIQNLAGKIVELETITDPVELQILFLREWYLREAICAHVQRAHDVSESADTKDVLDLEIDE